MQEMARCERLLEDVGGIAAERVDGVGDAIRRDRDQGREIDAPLVQRVDEVEIYGAASRRYRCRSRAQYADAGTTR